MPENNSPVLERFNRFKKSRKVPIKTKDTGISPESVEERFKQFKVKSPSSAPSATPVPPVQDPNIPQLRQAPPQPLPGIIKATGRFDPGEGAPDIPRFKDQLKLAGQILLSANPNDLAGTLKVIDPKGAVFNAPNGNLAFRFSNSGNEFELNPKGMDRSDLASFVANTAAFTAGMGGASNIPRVARFIKNSPVKGTILKAFLAISGEEGRQAGIKGLGGERSVLDSTLAGLTEAVTSVIGGRIGRSAFKQAARKRVGSAREVVKDLQGEAISNPDFRFAAAQAFNDEGLVRKEVVKKVRKALTSKDFKKVFDEADELKLRVDVDTLEESLKTIRSRWPKGDPTTTIENLLAQVDEVKKAGTALKESGKPEALRTFLEEGSPVSKDVTERVITGSNFENAHNLLKQINKQINGLRSSPHGEFDAFKMKTLLEAKDAIDPQLREFAPFKAVMKKFADISQTDGGFNTVTELFEKVITLQERGFVDKAGQDMVNKIFTDLSPREIRRLRNVFIDTGKVIGLDFAEMGAGTKVWNDLVKARIFQRMAKIQTKRILKSGDEFAELILTDLVKDQNQMDLLRSSLGIEATKNATWLNSTINSKARTPGQLEVKETIFNTIDKAWGLLGKARRGITGAPSKEELNRWLMAEVVTDPGFIKAIAPLRKLSPKNPLLWEKLRTVINNAGRRVSENLSGTFQGLDVEDLTPSVESSEPGTSQ